MAKILIVDDEHALLDAFAGVMRAHGHEVLTAASGVDGLQLAETEQVQAALIDVDMPTMNGFEVCRALCGLAKQRGAELTVWMMTGAVIPEYAALAVDCGARLLLRKPLVLRALLRELEERFAGPIAGGGTSAASG